jgi:hypothetical protein
VSADNKYVLDVDAMSRGFAGQTIESHGNPLRFEVYEIGALSIVSGRVVAADPLVFPEDPPFARAVPNGRHAVRLAMAFIFDDESYAAYARVDFSDAPAQRWEPALCEGERRAGDSNEDAFGYGVDSGRGCFMDPAAGALLRNRLKRPWFEDILLDRMDRRGKRGVPGLSFRPALCHRANVVMFKSGQGDGRYPSYFGIDAAGNVTALVTDFHVHNPPNAEIHRLMRQYRARTSQAVL